jgi:hypothetical protein
MMTFFRTTALAIFALLLLSACDRKHDSAATTEQAKDQAAEASQAMPRSPSPAGARVFFIAPKDGDVVPTTFTAEFGVEGMTVVHAGDNTPDSGHHHLLIDADLPDLTVPIPADANHVHFGDGRSSTELTLAPGQHTLQLLFADYLHIPHDPPVYSERITITVK